MSEAHLLERSDSQDLVTETLLDKVKFPSDFREFSLEELKILASELRAKTIEIVSKTGGHLGAGLGVVELTVALHHVFDTPKDLVVFDIGHQAYPHKILTGRKDQFETLRTKDGISGFTKRDESVYDSFGAGHSSTSISAALGMAVARDLKHEKKNVVAVIGDGALSAGMAYEAMNNAGDMRTKLTVILNDNDMSIAPAVGAMSNYLSRLISSPSFINIRSIAKAVAEKFPERIEKAMKKAEQYARSMATGGNFFEDMGFYYIGPLDGHNLDHLVPILKNIREDNLDRPILLHIVTEKGRGFKCSDDCSEKYHAIGKFDPVTGVLKKSVKTLPKYTDIFAQSLIEEASKDERIVAITAAMPSGTGLDKFGEIYPNRTFDVGIAEQHAVTFAAGLACEGLKPFVAIYSTFLQRAYDQVVHDVALQNLPVRFAIDRAGFVGADGPTHHGTYDLVFLTCLPNFVVMCPSSESELVHMIRTAACYNDGPIAFRYPRGEVYGEQLPLVPQILPIGKGRIINQGKDVAILSLGTRLNEVLKASQILQAENINPTIADARFAKPFDEELVRDLLARHNSLIIVEEGADGGFGSHILKFIHDHDLGVNKKIRLLTYPDYFIEQDSQDGQHNLARMDSDSIVALVRRLV